MWNLKYVILKIANQNYEFKNNETKITIFFIKRELFIRITTNCHSVQQQKRRNSKKSSTCVFKLPTERERKNFVK